MAETFTCALHRVSVTISRDEASQHEHRVFAGGKASCTLKRGIPVANLRDLCDGRTMQWQGVDYPLTIARVDASGEAQFERENLVRSAD